MHIAGVKLEFKNSDLKISRGIVAPSILGFNETSFSRFAEFSLITVFMSRISRSRLIDSRKAFSEGEKVRFYQSFGIIQSTRPSQFSVMF
jgi:hypothetical protein